MIKGYSFTIPVKGIDVLMYWEFSWQIMNVFDAFQLVIIDKGFSYTTNQKSGRILPITVERLLDIKRKPHFTYHAS